MISNANDFIFYSFNNLINEGEQYAIVVFTRAVIRR